MGFVNSKSLAACKRHQLWVSISRSQLFDEGALATALRVGQIEACILDGAVAGLADIDSRLHGLKKFFCHASRAGSPKRETGLRSSWYVAHRMHEAISNLEGTSGLCHFPQSAPMYLELPGALSPSQWGGPETKMR